MSGAVRHGSLLQLADSIKQVPKKQLLLTIPLIIAWSAFMPFRYLLWDTRDTDVPFWGWVFQIIDYFMFTLGYLAMARYVFPDHTHPPLQIAGYALCFVARCVFPEQGIDISCLFYLHIRIQDG